MGYTHYWRQQRDFTSAEWNELTRLTKLITADGSSILANGFSDRGSQPTIDNEKICFNGIGEDGHETFRITKKKREKADYEKQEPYNRQGEAYDRQGAFEFCKTAQKPYDKYVVAVLCALFNMKIKLDEEKYPVLYIRSDGNTADWTEGLFHALRSTREEEMLIPFQETVCLSYVDYLDNEKKTG